MSETALLQRILDAENQGRQLVEEAENTADSRLQSAAMELEDAYTASREKRLAELSAELEEHGHRLEAARQERLAAFNEALRKEPVFRDSAARAVRRIISLP